MIFLVDSNVCLRVAEETDPLHETTLKAMMAASVSNTAFCISVQVVSECWNVLTRPAKVNGFGLLPLSARNALERIFTIFPCADDPQNLGRLLPAFAELHNVSGRQIHDAKLALTCELLGLDGIVTYNKADFTRYTTIRALEPSELN